MLIVNLKGGLGNQLFQYALYTQLRKEGWLAFLDYSRIEIEMQRIKRSTIFEDFELDQQYHIDKMNGMLGKAHRGLFFRVFKKLAKVYEEQEESLYDPHVFDLKHGYLEGYWQSEKYFESCKEELRKHLQFKKELPASTFCFLDKIREAECPVSVHIRLGDYTQKDCAALFGNICTREYYTKAIRYFKEKYANPVFFVFSNEPHKALDVIDIPNAVVVDANDESAAWADMYLMSQCHHNIIANSSFSWWGAWLNENTHKTVIAPERWINGKETRDICPESWLRM